MTESKTLTAQIAMVTNAQATSSLSLCRAKQTAVNNIEQIWENVQTNATKRKGKIVHNHFRQKLSSSGVRRETDNKRRSDEYVFILSIFAHQLLLVYPFLCFFLLLLYAALLTPEEDSVCRKHLCTSVSLSFVALVSTFP